MQEDAMAYPGDFVAANRTARINAQHVANLRRKRRMPDLRRTYFRMVETLTKRTPPRIYSADSDTRPTT